MREEVRAMPRSGIRAIMDQARAQPDAIHLEVGEPDFDTPPHVTEAAVRAAKDGLTRYTPNRGLPRLVEALCTKLERVNGLQTSPEQVVVTAGAVNAIFASLSVLVEPGDVVLCPDPGWPNYRMMATLLGASAVTYPLLHESRFEPDVAALREQILATPKAKVLLLNTPGNPTGAVWSPEVLKAVLTEADRHGLYVISDEVYEEIVFDRQHTSAAAVSESDRVISAYSFSKTYAMTGWRVGYVVAPASIADLIAKAQEPLISCPTSVAQAAAIAALEGDQTYVADMRDSYRARRDMLVQLLTGTQLLAAVPQGAFYAMLKIGPAHDDSAAFAQRLLDERGIAVAPGIAFGPSCRSFVRISLATDAGLLNAGVRHIRDAVLPIDDGGPAARR